MYMNKEDQILSAIEKLTENQNRMEIAIEKLTENQLIFAGTQKQTVIAIEKLTGRVEQ